MTSTRLCTVLLFTSTLSLTAAAADSTLETPTGAYRKISFTAGGELKSIGQVEKAPAMMWRLSYQMSQSHWTSEDAAACVHALQGSIGP